MSPEQEYMNYQAAIDQLREMIKKMERQSTLQKHKMQPGLQ